MGQTPSQQQSEIEQDPQHNGTDSGVADGVQSPPHLEETHSGSDGSSGSTARQQRTWRQRLVRISIAAIKALLLLEVAAIVVPPLLPRGKSESNSDFEISPDPADVLMDYLEGRRGLSALQILDDNQLRQAVDNLITEDFQELGVKDRGAEIREIIEDIIKVREKGPRPPPQPERVGLGRVGPLKFRNKPSRTTVKQAAAEAAAAEES